MQAYRIYLTKKYDKIPDRVIGEMIPITVFDGIKEFASKNGYQFDYLPLADTLEITIGPASNSKLPSESELQRIMKSILASTTEKISYEAKLREVNYNQYNTPWPHPFN